tara:strand:+ start:138 stop:1043 length:906 start_codon:yes stop_codon:yes gene_type:complete
MGRIAVTHSTGDDVEKWIQAPLMVGRAFLARQAGKKAVSAGAKAGAKRGAKGGIVQGVKTAVKNDPLTAASMVQGAQAGHSANAQAAKQASMQQTMEAAQRGREISTGTAKSDDKPMYHAWAILKESMPGTQGYPEDDPDIKNRNCPVCKGVGWVQDPNGESPMNECWFCDGLKEDFTGQYEVGFNDWHTDNPMPEVYPDAPLFSERFQQKHTSEPMEVANRLLKARMEVGPHDEQQDELFEHLKNLNPQHSIRTNEEDNSFMLDNIHDQDEDVARRLIQSYDRNFVDGPPIEATPESDYF